jgi:peptide/nickel transport system ATP-binding protein
MAEHDLLLNVRDLTIEFGAEGHAVRVVDHIRFDVHDGETVALVGESGCGKSVTALSLAKLIPQPPGRFADGEIHFCGREVLGMAEKDLRRLRGADISYVFQEPSQSLNPVFRIGWQIREALRLHRPDQATDEAVINLLKQVGLPEPAQKLRAYPHELSGGMQQRVMIAMALACRPRLLVADEPTTALDVTIQLQILELLKDLQQQMGMAVILITHNLGLVAGYAHRVNVMYAGRIIESGPTEKVLGHPRHPYTKGLLQAVPKLEGSAGHLKGIDGNVPNPARMPSGCKFHPRCSLCAEVCKTQEPKDESVQEGHVVRCHFWRKGGESS